MHHANTGKQRRGNVLALLICYYFYMLWSGQRVTITHYFESRTRARGARSEGKKTATYPIDHLLIFFDKKAKFFIDSYLYNYRQTFFFKEIVILQNWLKKKRLFCLSCPESGFQELTLAGFLQNFGYRSGSGLLIFLLKQDQDCN